MDTMTGLKSTLELGDPMVSMIFVSKKLPVDWKNTGPNIVLAQTKIIPQAPPPQKKSMLYGRIQFHKLKQKCPPVLFDSNIFPRPLPALIIDAASEVYR